MPIPSIHFWTKHSLRAVHNIFLCTTLFSIAAFSSACSKSGLDGDQPDAGGAVGAPCDVDTDCQENLQCIDGACGRLVDECALDTDCAATENCLAGQCVPNGDCEEDTDCPSDQACVLDICTRAGNCEQDTDCPRNFSCEDGVCRQATPDCAVDADCDDGEVCQDGECFTSCEGNGDCDDDERCLRGICVEIGPCEVNVDCPAFATCNDDVCIQIGECAEDSDCGDFATCDDGTCVRNDACENDDDCPATQFCNTAADVCENNNPCNVDEQCPNGQFCDDGICTRRACESDAECSNGQVCDLFSGLCATPAACEVNDDCPALKDACVDGICVDIGACDSNEECPDFAACVDVGGNNGQRVCLRSECRVDADCNDNQFCNGVEVCDLQALRCAPSNVPQVDDGIDCTIDVCDEATDSVVHTATAARCDDGNPCTLDACVAQTGCSNTPDDLIVPPQTDENGDCVLEVCLGGEVQLVANNVETPRQNSGNDCQQEICSNGFVVSVANDNELAVQNSANDCLRQTCVGGRAVNAANDAEIPQQASANDCVRNFCQDGSVVETPDDAEVPTQISSTDCFRQVCEAGLVATVVNDDETPNQISNVDCRREVCSTGDIISVANDAETPNQVSATDCLRNICQGGAPATAADNTETPAQRSATDCQRDICQNGVTASVADDAENPGTLGACAEGSCVAGQPTFVPNNELCEVAACEVPVCDANGSCSGLPNNGFCDDCGTGQVGLCRSADRNADANGCVCVSPAVLTCAINPDIVEVLQPAQLSAQATGAQPGSTFLWQVTGVPAGAQIASQIIEDPSAAVTNFIPLNASALNVKDYVVQVTLREPGLPDQNCEVRLEARSLPDDFEVTLLMEDNLDIDLHVVGGQNAIAEDMNFHPQRGVLGGNPNRDCFFANCPVCTVDIPQQTQTLGACQPLLDPNRPVDFDIPPDGVSLADQQDPQLDIDNRLGCVPLDDVGNELCVPEKVTVENVDAGTYFVWLHLFGNAGDGNTGAVTNPTVTNATIEVKCRGQTLQFRRTLTSVLADGVTAANGFSFERIGGANGFVRVEVPENPLLPCSITGEGQIPN